MSMNRIDAHLATDRLRTSSDNGHAKTPIMETSKDVAEAVDAMHEQFLELRRQLAGVIVGQDEVAEQLLIAMLCKGHCILQGMPGLAKTMLVSTMASLIDLSFRRVQFTPDLMPGDITGTEVLQEDQTTGKRVFQFIEGPLFGNVILADENQPHASEDSKRSPGSDAGTSVNGMRKDIQTAGSVLCFGDAESCGNRRNLSTAGSSAG